MSNVFSQRLKEARERSNLMQKEVQEQIGVNNRTLSGYENGKSEPDYDTLIALSNLYDVSVDWLLGRTDNFDVPVTSVKDKSNIIDLSDLSIEVRVNGRMLTEEEKRKVAALALILFG